MKRLLVSLLSLICVLTLSSCDNLTNTPMLVTTENTESDVADTSGNSQNDDEKTFNLCDTVKVNNWNITVNSLEYKKSIPNGEYFEFTPDSGNKYAVANITIKNIGTSADTFLNTFSLTSNSVNLIYDDKYNYSSCRLLGSDDDLHDKTCNPLTEVTGIIAFQVPEEVESSDKPLHLTIVDKSTNLIVKIR